jgi:hypothetical protein
MEQGHRPDFCLLQRAGRPQRSLASRPRHAGRHRRQPHRARRLARQRTACGKMRSPRRKRKKPTGPTTGSTAWTTRTRNSAATVTGQLVLNDPQAATTKLPHLTVGLAHPDYTSAPGGFVAVGQRQPGHLGARRQLLPVLDRRHEDGKFTITNVRPGTYTLHAFADGVLGEFAQTNITVDGRQESVDLGKLEWKPVRYGKQDLGNRLPRPHRRQILQGRRRQLLALGLVSCATRSCSRTTSPTPLAKAITTRTGSWSRCRMEKPRRG